MEINMREDSTFSVTEYFIRQAILIDNETGPKPTLSWIECQWQSRISALSCSRQIDPGGCIPRPSRFPPSATPRRYPRQSRANHCRGRAPLSPVANRTRAFETRIPVCEWLKHFRDYVRSVRRDACLASESPDCLSCANEYVCSWALLLFPGERWYRSWMPCLIFHPWLIICQWSAFGYALTRVESSYWNLCVYNFWHVCLPVARFPVFTFDHLPVLKAPVGSELSGSKDRK